MFSSLATFLFGSQPTESELKDSEANPAQASNGESSNEPSNGDVIEVTSSTPSVAGNNRGTVRSSGKQRKNRRGKQRHNHQQQQQQGGQRKQPPTITKLLTPSGEKADDDFDEDEWYIVEKEDEEDDSLPRSDSEEELSIVEVQGKAATAPNASAGSRRRQHINSHTHSHSLYSGPRPQQQRNFLQRNRAARPLSISTLSPPAIAVDVDVGQSADNSVAVTQSLYAPSPALSPSGSDQGNSSSSSSDSGSSNGGQGASVLMEESWYVTPPPCFTSIGPINMETSPFENLLIEHPSMSVYHSIRSTQEGTESFVNLDLVAEPEQPPEQPASQAVAPQRSNSARFDRHAAAQLKQQALARQSQKSNTRKQHEQLCRSAIKRANKVRDFQAKSNRPRRSDMQHCKLISGANNNRKCCY